METDVRKSIKRRKIIGSHVAETSSLWHRCHSGFDDEIILNEQLGLNVKSSKGRRKDKKIPEKCKAEEVLSLIEKEVDIDWESSSSEDESSSHLQGQSSIELPEARRTKRKQAGLATPGVTSHWVVSVTGQRETAAQKESAVLINNVEESPSNAVASAMRELDEDDISDYDSSEEPGPAQVSSSPPNQDSASPKITASTQSPLISSFTLSTQGSIADTTTSPISSSQWVDIVKQGQQTTPSKDARKSRHHVEAEGKDSATKKMKFTRCGFAEKLQKLINREKSDVAFWNHQAVLESGTSGALCSVQIETINPSRGLFVARCQNLSHSVQQEQGMIKDLPERLVVLFSRRFVKDHQLQVGSSVTIHPPWQTMLLPDTDETVLLCTYYCKISGSEGPAQSSSPSTSAPCMAASSELDVINTSRQVFRPNRLFADDRPSPGFCLDAPHKKKRLEQIPTSLVHTVSAKGPSFDFEFDLRVLVMRVCRIVASSTRPSTLHQEKWRLVVQDIDGTIFEVNTTSSTMDLTSWKGKLMEFTSLTISQRVSRMSNPSLFSMIDLLSQPAIPEKDLNSNTTVKQMTSASSLQSISYIVNLDMIENASECTDRKALGMYNYRSLDDVYCKLSDICQHSFQPGHRVSFCAMLLHATSKEVTNPVASPWQAGSGNQLLFVTDSSLTESSQSQTRPTSENYVMAEKSSRCPMTITGCTDLKDISGSRLHFHDVHMREDGSLSLDCYSNIRSEDWFRERGKDSGLADRCKQIDKATIKFPELTDGSSMNTLVTLTGILDGVDQETAYSWPVCNVCGSNRLEEDSSGSKLLCLTCSREVTSPVTNIHLEAIVKSPVLSKGNTIKVLLKQETVSDLFGDPSSDEPFDLKRILGKRYQQTNCFVRTSARDASEFKLEEI